MKKQEHVMKNEEDENEVDENEDEKVLQLLDMAARTSHPPKLWRLTYVLPTRSRRSVDVRVYAVIATDADEARQRVHQIHAHQLSDYACESAEAIDSGVVASSSYTRSA